MYNPAPLEPPSPGLETTVSISDDFKNTLASWPSGVTVVTAQVEGLVYGLTVSSFSSLSMDPPLILVCLNNANRLPSMIVEAGQFGVSILDRSQETASNHFARAGRTPSDDFASQGGAWLSPDLPVVADALGHIACRHHESVLQGDHTIIIGEVQQASANEDGQPLVYYRRAYRSVATS
ncbi:MAG TPA: hypothetical protein DIU15_07410 [Deltaproteobacteria bacterium]|nr:hypothetical protein [Deltaproteobacteria bacterium]HCP45852.1 hypothetical protein [Deltaproteobacteria bacterium]